MSEGDSFILTTYHPQTKCPSIVWDRTTPGGQEGIKPKPFPDKTELQS